MSAPEREREIESFKTRAWDDAGRAADYERRVYRRRARAKNLVEDRYVRRYASGRVLDAGAGTGRFALSLLRAGRDVVAFDISAPMLRIGVEKSAGRLSAAVADILHTPFADASFDGVVSITVLEHLPRHREALRELCRVLRPGGTIVFQLRSAEHRLRSGLAPSAEIEDFVVELTRSEIEQLLADAGLEPLVIAPYALLNGNRVAERYLGRAYRPLQRLALELFALPPLAWLLARLELGLLRRAPLWLSCTVIVVARKPAREGQARAASSVSSNVAATKRTSSSASA